LKVVATIKPIHAIVARVMEGVGTPALLVQGQASPHTYSLKPSDARALNDADVVFRVSEQIEPFTGKIARSLPKSVEFVTLAEAPGLTLHERRRSGTFEAHDHGAKGHHHDHDDEDGAGGRDAHIWLDPDNARKLAAHVADVLARRAPEHKEKLAANAARLDADIAALAGEIATELAPVAGRPFVVFHDAYQYFERRFGLMAIGSITVSPDVQPSGKRLNAVRRKIEKLGAVCVFAEPQFQPKLVAAVTEGTNARAGTLDPEGVLLEPGPEAYAQLLRNLARNLKSCLTPSS
jgi:zinc transport system substrate-binding protein